MLRWSIEGHGMMRIVIVWLMFTGTALALTPPIGWTPIGLDRAVVDPKEPARGEIYELRVAEGSGSPAELVAALSSHDVTVERFGTDEGGLINLVADDRLGRARVLMVEKLAIWWVVMVSPDHARNIDPDALLQAMAPPPTQVAWGAREAIPGGHDGSPWGEVKSASETVGGWAQSSTQTAWNQDPLVVGIWVGNARMRGVMTKLRLRFENTGMLQIQRTDEQGEHVHEGNWATRTGLMQLDITDGGANLPYMTTERTLTLSYAGASLTLYKQ